MLITQFVVSALALSVYPFYNPILVLITFQPHNLGFILVLCVAYSPFSTPDGVIGSLLNP